MQSFEPSWLLTVAETHLLPSDMNSLDILGVRVLIRALEQIHSSLDLDVLPEALFSALEDLVPDAGCSLDQLDLQTGDRNGRDECEPGRSGADQGANPGTIAFAPGNASLQSRQERRDSSLRLHHSTAVPRHASLPGNVATHRVRVSGSDHS
jgi:hypothetical protein